MSDTAYLVVKKSRAGTPLAIGVFSEANPTIDGPAGARLEVKARVQARDYETARQALLASLKPGLRALLRAPSAWHALAGVPERGCRHGRRGGGDA